jgi:hypothetical protein
MKKILLIPVLFGLLVFPAANILAATQTVPDLTAQQMMDALSNVVNWLFTILLIVAAIFIVIAAYYFVTASGNPESVSRARNFVMYALIGVAVAVAARGLVALARSIIESK